MTDFAKFFIPFASDFADTREAMFCFVCYVVEYALHYLFWVTRWRGFFITVLERVFNIIIAILRTGGRMWTTIKS